MKVCFLIHDMHLHLALHQIPSLSLPFPLLLDQQYSPPLPTCYHFRYRKPFPYLIISYSVHSIIRYSWLSRRLHAGSFPARQLAVAESQ